MNIERIKYELRNPRTLANLILLVVLVGMIGVLAFKTPTMKITGKVTGIDENGTVYLSNTTIDGSLIDNGFNGYYVVLKVEYIKGLTMGYPQSVFENFQSPENLRLPENFKLPENLSGVIR